MHIHQNTILSVLVNAPRMIFPTVAGLLVEVSFVHPARQYVRHNPPESAVLYEYGSSFSQ